MQAAETVRLSYAVLLSLLCIVSAAPTTAGNLPISTNGQCQTNGAICGPGYCCSRYGWCGATSDYCSAGCQPAWGACSSPATSASSSPQTPTSATPPATTSTSPPTSTIALTITQQSTFTSAPARNDGSDIRPRWCDSCDPELRRPRYSCHHFWRRSVSMHVSDSAEIRSRGRSRDVLHDAQNWACVYDHAAALKAAFDAGHQIVPRKTLSPLIIDWARRRNLRMVTVGAGVPRGPCTCQPSA